ncbi:MAG: TadE/TadG family type IV pilus assembly protein [Gemmataceae bacterium]
MLRRQEKRRGVASIELAVVCLFFIFPVLFGVWEIGRLVQVQQIVSNSARDGARLAAQGYTVNLTGSPTQIMASSGTINVRSAVYQYLIGAGLTNLAYEDVSVTFTFISPTSGGTYPTDPYLGEKGQRFTVAVSIPWSKVRWVDMGIIKPSTVDFVVTWQMMVDDKFTVNETLPIW